MGATMGSSILSETASVYPIGARISRPIPTVCKANDKAVVQFRAVLRGSSSARLSNMNFLRSAEVDPDIEAWTPGFCGMFRGVRRPRPPLPGTDTANRTGFARNGKNKKLWKWELFYESRTTEILLG